MTAPVVCAGASDAGRSLARTIAGRLGANACFDDRPLAEAVPDAWQAASQLVLVCAAGIAVRLAAPLLSGKHDDPGIVVVDDAGRHAISLSGGHEGGANLLARHVADLIGAEAVITTASELVADRVIGLGCSSEASADEIVGVLPEPWTATCIATLELKARQPTVVEAAARVGLPIVAFTAPELAAVTVPNPSEVVRAAVGTPSVAEAAALLASGAAALDVEKRATARVTVAVARTPAAHVAGCLTIVGIGPGDPLLVPPAARRALRAADDVVGFSMYVEQAARFTRPDTALHASPIGDELARGRLALDLARSGRRVALVSSGDAGVYAMGAPTLELGTDGVGVTVVPGITAALAAAAAVGAPLGHDHASISLSDLLTPWEAIERRLQAAAQADFVVALYNPRSERRTWQLPKAIGILGAHRPPTTPVVVVTDATRPGERVSVTTLADLDPETVGMTSIVVVGASTTRVVDGLVVTPRGYDTT